MCHNVSAHPLVISHKDPRQDIGTMMGAQQGGWRLMTGFMCSSTTVSQHNGMLYPWVKHIGIYAHLDSFGSA